jgi:hypothetical protein
MEGLEAGSAEEIQGPPHHGSVMFRRDAYEAVGGYRPAFYVAQDIDLWLRLVEVGRHISLGKVLYRAHASPASISFCRRPSQLAATGLAVEARNCRMRDEPEGQVLEEAWRVTRQPARSTRRSGADYHYFVAGCQRQSLPARARRHYFQALATNPLHWRAFLRWLQCTFAYFHGPPGGK